MAVYVDTLMNCLPNKNWPYSKSCHLIADSLEELHEFAIKKVGLKRAWFQDKPGSPHYDLNESKREVAVKAGAIELNRNNFIAKLKEVRAKVNPAEPLQKVLEKFEAKGLKVAFSIEKGKE